MIITSPLWNLFVYTVSYVCIIVYLCVFSCEIVLVVNARVGEVDSQSVQYLSFPDVE